MFEFCPYAYYQCYVQKTRPRGKFDHGLWVGTLVHLVLKNASFNAMQGKSQPSLANSLSDLQAFWSSNASKAIADGATIDDWNGVFEASKLKLSKYFDKFVLDPKRLIGAEVPLKAWIDGFLFFGIADRFDSVENGVKIVDYKTGSKGDVRQLLLYGLLFKNSKPGLNVSLEFQFIDTGVSQVVEFDGNAEKVKNWALTNARDIQKCSKTRDFKPSPGLKCAYCDFFSQCPYCSHALLKIDNSERAEVDELFDKSASDRKTRLKKLVKITTNKGFSALFGFKHLVVIERKVSLKGVKTRLFWKSSRLVEKLHSKV